jgi:hypothetical protein
MKHSYSIPLTVDGLMAKSRDIAGVNIIDDEIVEPLTVLHRAFNEDSQLHEQGALAKQNQLLRLLSNRLRMQRDFAAHPEIAEQEIKAPIFAMGMTRSGTTKTQKILCASGDFNWLPYWQVYNPALFTGSRTESTEPRIRETSEYCDWFDAATPEAKFGHSFETFEPEEDTALNEGCLRTPSFFAFAGVPSYLNWLSTQSFTPMFRFLRDSLKYLQWQGLASPSKRWLTKCPIYYGLEPFLLETFPDASFIMTHRTPVDTIPSTCKLVTLFHIPFSDAPVDIDGLNIGIAAMMDLHLANRRTISGLKILDLGFDEINRSIDTAVKKVYDFIGMPLSATALQNMQEWSANNPMHKKGAFRYSLAEFGLSEEKIKHDMSAYIEFMAAAAL